MARSPLGVGTLHHVDEGGNQERGGTCALCVAMPRIGMPTSRNTRGHTQENVRFSALIAARVLQGQTT